MRDDTKRSAAGEGAGMMTGPMRREGRDVDRGGFARFPLDWQFAGATLWRFSVLVGIWTVIGLLITRALAGTLLLRTDTRISEWFESVRTATWNDLTDLGSAFSDTITIVIALLVLIPVLLITKRRWRDAIFVTGSVVLETSVFVTAGFLVGRERPPVEQLDMSPPTASFPSGHTAAAVAFYLALALIVYWSTSNKAVRLGALAVGGTIPVLVAISRLYRGMHYTTDVIFGALLGIAAVFTMHTLVTQALRRRAHEPLTDQFEAAREVVAA